LNREVEKPLEVRRNSEGRGEVKEVVVVENKMRTALIMKTREIFKEKKELLISVAKYADIKDDVPIKSPSFKRDPHFKLFEKAQKK